MNNEQREGDELRINSEKALNNVKLEDDKIFNSKKSSDKTKLREKLAELETLLADNAPDYLVKLNLQNPKRVTRKMMTELVPNLPVCDESRKFCDCVLKSSIAMSDKSASLRNQIADKFSVPEMKALSNEDDSVQDKIDIVVEEALEDGVENAVEEFVEKKLEEVEEPIESDRSKLETKIDGLIEVVNTVLKSLEKNVSSALTTVSNEEERMKEQTKKMEKLSSDNDRNVKKSDHLARVLEMMNREEVEGNIVPGKVEEGRSQKSGKSKEKTSYENEKKEKIKMMLGLK